MTPEEKPIKLFVEYATGKKFTLTGVPRVMRLKHRWIIGVDLGEPKPFVILDPRAILRDETGTIVLQLTKEQIREAFTRPGNN